MRGRDPKIREEDMRKRSLSIVAIGTACVVLLGGCSGISQLMPAQQETQSESVPEESSVAEVVIDPEEQARLDLLNSLESVSIPTTTETSRKNDSGVAAPYENGAEEEDESAESDGSKVLITGAWLSDDETKQEFYSENDSLQLAVPLDWKNLNGQITNDDEVNQSFSVQVGNPDQAVFFMANSESRRYSPFMSLDEYSSAIVAAVYHSMSGSEVFSNAELVETVDIESDVEDFVIRKSVISASYEDNPIVYYIYAVQGNYRYFQFNCWTAESQKDSAEAVFDEIVRGFHEQ